MTGGAGSAQAPSQPLQRRIVPMLTSKFWIGAALWFAVGIATAAEIQIAVASNFSRVGEVLASQFEESTGHRAILIAGSTGKHFAQISNGAPFDVLLAADSRYPEELEKRGLAVEGSRVAYALGRLVLWSPSEDSIDGTGKVIEDGDFRHLAMANPELAPYGHAAREVLISLNLWESLQDRTVRGENVGQAFQFVASGNAEIGFVALSQITAPGGKTTTGSYWLVPQTLYTPIEQQAVMVSDSTASRDFMEFIQSVAAKAVIEQYGYAIPGAETTHHAE